MKKLALCFSVIVIAVLAVLSVNAESVDMTYESRGVQVPATLVTPDGLDEYPLVVFAHGHGGSRDEYLGFPDIAAGLEERGIASIRMDFPGCGDSTEPFTENYLSNMKEDFLTALAWAKENLPVTKVGAFGYSMGGRIVVSMLADGNEFDAVCLLAPAVSNDRYTKATDRFSHYEEAVENGVYTVTTAYGQIQDLSPKWFEDLMVTDFEDIKDAAKETLAESPIIVLYGEDDTTIPPELSLYVADFFGAPTVAVTGNGHSYSFYTTEKPELRELIVNTVGNFFAENL